MENHSSQQKVTRPAGSRRAGRKKKTWIEVLSFVLAAGLFLYFYWPDIAANFGLETAASVPASEATGTNDTAASGTNADTAADIHFIDVGQGDSILIEQGGEYALIDTGTPASRDALIAYLDKAGVKTIKYLILTHYHADHIGGAVRVLENYTVENVLLPNAEFGPTVTSSTALKLMEKVSALTSAGSLTAKVPAVGESYPLGEGELKVAGAGIDVDDDLNSTSLIFLFQIDGFSYYTSGDADTDAENELLSRMGASELHSDLYKATHHGSRTGNSTALLDAVQPKVIVISCGLDNDYGHPHAEAMERMAATGAKIYRTDLEGSVVVHVADGQMTVTTEKEGSK